MPIAPVSYTQHKNYPRLVKNICVFRLTVDLLIFFFLFWTGLCDPIACSIAGGGIPTQNSGYKSTRPCPSRFRFATFSPPCSWPVVSLGDCSSVLRPAPIRSTWHARYLRLLLTSSRGPVWLPVQPLLRLRLRSRRRLRRPFPRPLQVYYGLLPHRRDTRAPGRRVAPSHRSRIVRVAIFCTTILCLRVTDVCIPTISTSLSASARGGQLQLPYLFRRGCLPLILLAFLD